MFSNNNYIMWNLFNMNATWAWAAETEDRDYAHMSLPRFQSEVKQRQKMAKSVEDVGRINRWAKHIEEIRKSLPKSDGKYYNPKYILSELESTWNECFESYEKYMEFRDKMLEEIDDSVLVDVKEEENHVEEEKKRQRILKAKKSGNRFVALDLDD